MRRSARIPSAAERGGARWRGLPHAMAVAAGVSVAAGACMLLFTTFTVFRLHVPLPYWDEWYSIVHFRRFAEGRYGLADLAAQHNEHRLLFPRLFFFADELLFGMSGLLNATVTLLLQVANAVILVVLTTRLVARPAHRALLSGFVFLMLFTLRQEQNFTNGFQLQFVGVFTAAALAAMAYAAALERLRLGWTESALPFAAAALCCFVSTYTMANGVMLGPVLVLAAILRRAPWPVPAATAALSALLAAAFFWHYTPGSSTYAARDALAHAWAYPRYFTAYLGNPIGSDVRATQALGVAGVLMALGAAWRVATGRSPSSASLALLILAVFVIATDAATTYGRIASGTEQALESRYATPSILFWMALVVFWFPAATARAARVTAPLLAALMLLLGATAIASEASVLPDLEARSAALRRSSDSLISGLYDTDAAGTYEITSPGEIAGFVPFLRAHHLAAFADPDAAALGRSLAVLGRPAPAADCVGTASARADPALGPGGVKLGGTAYDREGRRAPHRIVVADAAGTVVGFGSASLPGELSRRWAAYARAKPGDTLQAYARLADGALCGLGAATPVEPPAGR